jgi:acyl carrier protein
MQPAPAGVSGELYIAGAGLARGYLHRPELTAERFLPHPFSREAGQRLYRTGDLGRYRVNGEIECLGRVDQQVKVRGYRIELGEIEQVLCEQAGVRQAAVVVRESEVGQRLIAFVTGEAVSGAELRERMREKLPEYMTPQAVVVLEELPLLPNGKVDRRRLQEIEVARAEVRQGPRTAIEELVCGIWGEVLGVEQVGVGEEFFELGGHSLLATQVMSRVREVFGVEVPLRRFFESPTVAGLSIAIVQCQAEQSESAELARLIAELDQLSDDDARVMLAGEELE